ncbi:MAG: WXG100 family type VII secretion target [Anaerolineales bacterium]
MADKILVNYPALDDMAKNCDQFAQRLRQTVSMASQTAQQMQGGAMQGEFGDVFVEALGVFQAKVNKLADKFAEIAGDIRGAESDMQAADNTAGSKF